MSTTGQLRALLDGSWRPPGPRQTDSLPFTGRPDRWRFQSVPPGRVPVHDSPVCTG